MNEDVDWQKLKKHIREPVLVVKVKLYPKSIISCSY